MSTLKEVSPVSLRRASPDDLDKRKLFRLEEQFELTSPTSYTYTLTLPEEIYQDQRAYQESLSDEGKIYEVTP